MASRSRCSERLGSTSSEMARMRTGREIGPATVRRRITDRGSRSGRSRLWLAGLVALRLLHPHWRLSADVLQEGCGARLARLLEQRRERAGRLDRLAREVQIGDVRVDADLPLVEPEGDAVVSVGDPVAVAVTQDVDRWQVRKPIVARAQALPASRPIARPERGEGQEITSALRRLHGAPGDLRDRDGAHAE